MALLGDLGRQLLSVKARAHQKLAFHDGRHIARGTQHSIGTLARLGLNPRHLAGNCPKRQARIGKQCVVCGADDDGIKAPFQLGNALMRGVVVKGETLLKDGVGARKTGHHEVCGFHPAPQRECIVSVSLNHPTEVRPALSLGVQLCKPVDGGLKPRINKLACKIVIRGM